MDVIAATHVPLYRKNMVRDDSDSSVQISFSTNLSTSANGFCTSKLSTIHSFCNKGFMQCREVNEYKHVQQIMSSK